MASELETPEGVPGRGERFAGEEKRSKETPTTLEEEGDGGLSSGGGVAVAPRRWQRKGGKNFGEFCN